MDEDQYNLNPNQNGPQAISTPVKDVIATITSFQTSYPDDPDYALLYLRSLTSADSISIDDIANSTLNKAIQSTCDYIVGNYYPFSDDACELFMIQAQSYIRFGTWHDYSKVLQFCQWARECSPNYAQSNLITEIENAGYSYKLKSFIERAIVGTVSTWFAFEGFLFVANAFFPFAKTEYDRKFDEIGARRNEDGSLDIEQYTSYIYPRLISEYDEPLSHDMAQEYHQLSDDVQRHAKKYMYPHHHMYMKDAHDGDDDGHHDEDGDDDDDDDYDDDE